MLGVFSYFLYGFNDGIHMKLENFHRFIFNIHWHCTEHASCLPLRIGPIKAFILIPCLLYLFLFPFSGDCFGSGNGDALAFENGIHNKDMVVFSEFDVCDSIIEGSQKIIDELSHLLSSFHKDSVGSRNNGGQQINPKSTNDAKQIEIALSENDSEDIHFAFLVSLCMWLIGAFIGGIIIICLGTQRIGQRRRTRRPLE